MSENTDRAVVEIDVFSDPVCPWCFIGKRRLAAALEQRPDIDARIRWRTFQLNPDMPPEGMERQTYLSAKFGGPERASEIYSHIGRVGAQVGIDFQFDQIRKTPCWPIVLSALPAVPNIIAGKTSYARFSKAIS